MEDLESRAVEGDERLEESEKVELMESLVYMRCSCSCSTARRIIPVVLPLSLASLGPLMIRPLKYSTNLL